MDQLAGGLLVGWLLIAPLVGVLVSSGWGGRHSHARDDDAYRRA